MERRGPAAASLPETKCPRLPPSAPRPPQGSRAGTASSATRDPAAPAVAFAFKPPLPDSRDQTQRALDGPGRDAFLGVHKLRLVRIFRFFHPTLGGKAAVEYLGANDAGADDLTLNFNNVLGQFERLVRGAEESAAAGAAGPLSRGGGEA